MLYALMLANNHYMIVDITGLGIPLASTGLTKGSVVPVLKFSFYNINVFFVFTVFLGTRICFHCWNCHGRDANIRLEMVVRISVNATFIVHSDELCEYYLAANLQCLTHHPNLHCRFNSTTTEVLQLSY